MGLSGQRELGKWRGVTLGFGKMVGGVPSSSLSYPSVKG